MANIALIFTTPILQIRKLRFPEVGPLAQGQTAMEVSVIVWDSNEGLLSPKPRFIPPKQVITSQTDFLTSPTPFCMCTPDLYDQS